jgi:CRP-like cAMP-binding protein
MGLRGRKKAQMFSDIRQKYPYPRSSDAQEEFLLNSDDILGHIQGLQRFLLASCLSIQTYSGTKPIFDEGQPGSCLYIIQKGEVLIYKTKGEATEDGDADGKTSYLTILGPGKVFGEMACLDKTKPERSASAKPIGVTTVFILDVDAFDTIQAEFPSLALNLLVRDLTDRMRENNAHIQVLSSLHRAQRVARFLADMADQRGHDVDANAQRGHPYRPIRRFDLGMPQTVVAKLLHMSDAALTEQLGMLEKDNIIRRDYIKASRTKSGDRPSKPQRPISILSMDQLRKRAKG